MNGIELIAAERQRQIEAEGFTFRWDDQYTEGQPAKAASCYALPPGYDEIKSPPEHWPWHEMWWKPGDRIRELAKAGALIAAEIDRLQRAEAKKDSP